MAKTLKNHTKKEIIMRENLPVTQEEYPIPKGLTLVSRTDLNGTIVECNDSFEIISGFKRSELIGQPHNLVRHPDVPPAVFKDMWQTLKSGMPWTQIVKNRRKDGSYYWVRANVTPVYDMNGQNTGYLSVREAVSESEKQAAAKAYQALHKGQARIEQGNVHTGINWQKWNLWTKLGPRSEMVVLALLLGVAPLILTHTFLEVTPTMIGVVSVLMLLVAWLMGSYLQTSIRQAVSLLRKVAGGEQVLDVKVKPNYTGKLYGAIQSSALAMGAYRSNLETESDRARRLQMAVDQAWVNMMMLDADGKIVYLNQQLKDFFASREATLANVISGFNAAKLIDQPMDLFNVDGAGFVLNQADTQYREIEMAGMLFCLKLVAVHNRAGVHVGTVVEWEDKTLTAQLLQEVKKIHDGILVGDLGYRVDLEKADKELRPVAEALNMTLDSIVRSIDMSTEVAIAMSVGDFQQSIEQPCPGYFGVVKEALTVSMENISDILSGVQEVSELIDTDSKEVRRASTELSSSSQSQAASIEETSASMEEMTSAVQSSSDNAQDAASQTHDAAAKAAQGVKVMQDAIQSMEAISHASQRIGDIITLIDSIAFQTNLLALNAAVEAARAGEHGRGFAVVAGEVRNLAGKSSDAAKEIRGLIEDTLEKVEQGSAYVNDSGDSLNEIHQSIQKVQSIIDDISKSSREQTQGISQVNIAISDIDSQVQKNAIMAESTSQTAKQLESLTHAMTQNAQTFKIQPKSHKTALDADANFVRIRMAHRQWRAKARAYIHGFDVGVDPQKAVDPRACELGQWIYGAGQQYASFPSFQQLEKSHQAMHAHIGKIIQLKEIGDNISAETNLDELERLSREVVDAINEMETHLAEVSGSRSVQANHLPDSAS